MKVSLMAIFLLCSSVTIQNVQRQVEIIVVDYGCDFDHSILFEGIKRMGFGAPCSAGFKFKTSDFYDSIIHYLQPGKLIEDSISHSRAYGTNLEVYIGASENDSLKYEFAIDYKGYVFFNDKTYFPSKELNQFLCSKVVQTYCFCKK
jgi:hypothetical protein